MKYIDTRGVWPVYINGLIAITLEGQSRNITIEEAEAIIAKMNQDKK